MCVFDFKEQRGNRDVSLPSVKDLPSGWADPDLKERVVLYMAYKDHTVFWNSGRGVKDAFDGCEIPASGNSWRDGCGNHWTDEHTYYVDVHDILVSDAFVADIE